MDDVRPFPRRPQPPRDRGGPKRRGRWRGRVLAIGIPLIIVIGALLRYWVDLLWFQELDQRSVLVTRLQWSTTVGIAVGLLTFAVLWVNFWIARRVAKDDLYIPFLAVPDREEGTELPAQPVLPHFVLRPIMLGISAVVAVLAGLSMSSRWEVVLRFLGRTDFGMKDPHFGKDASFYVFTLPLMETIVRFLQVLTVGTAIAVIAAYVFSGVIRYLPVFRIARPAIVHLSVIVAVFLVVSALQYRLSIWNLATGKRGVVAGAGWTDTHARIPGYWLMIVASLVLAVMVVVFARREKWKVVGGSIVGWVAASILFTGMIPSAVQQVLVKPNELDRESKVLAGNITNTRAAFDLGDIENRPFKDEAKLTSDQLLKSNTDTTDNLRLWSPSVLQSVIQQQQSLRRYYTFNDVDVDRYQVGDDYRQVMVAVRELNPDASTVASSWTNQRLVYTHGFGAVATWPNEATNEGQPEYILKNLPPKPQGQDEIKLDRSEVYFGEAPEEPAIVGTRQFEISPKGGDEEDGENARTKYEGEGGVKLNSLARRVAFATTFGDRNLLFTNQLTGKSRILFRRNIKDRVQHLAPFLTLDNDPYAVLVDGRIKWVLDAYTTSDRFPYSESLELGVSSRGGTTSSVNYVRNSVKAVVDAYDGDVKLYVADDKDPILKSWRDIFPKLFTDMDKMPKNLRAHMRYPEDLFRLQTNMWLRYHMDDVADFYPKEDLWEVPTLDGREMEPFYVLARLPGEKRAEMLLVRPLNPATKKNMIAYMVARNDGADYGKLITFELPADEQTQGPSQIQALIRQDNEVAEQVRRWESGTTKVIYGNLLVLPVESSLLYVQPVYLQNGEAQIPEFQRIVVALGPTVAWGSTYEEAVRSLLAEIGDKAAGGDGEDETPAEGDDDPIVDDGSGGDEGTPPAVSPSDFDNLDKEQLQTLLEDVSTAYNAALACQKRGDWACYGRETAKIQSLLDAARSAAPAAAAAKS